MSNVLKTHTRKSTPYWMLHNQMNKILTLTHHFKSINFTNDPLGVRPGETTAAETKSKTKLLSSGQFS